MAKPPTTAKSALIVAIVDDDSSLRVTDGSANAVYISFRRTIRVPDNGVEYHLPPDLGNFPIHPIVKYVSKFPKDIVKKNGVFIPMHQKEAFWIKFDSWSGHPFAVKIYVGGINVISGEKKRKKDPVINSEQDYIVVPDQHRLDGIAKPNGKVMQFVATRVGSGYSVEAQINGSDIDTVMHFEIIPAYQETIVGHAYVVFVKDGMGKTDTIIVNPSMTIEDLKFRIRDIRKTPPHVQRLIFAGKLLGDDRTLAYYNVESGSTILLGLSTRGGGEESMAGTREVEKQVIAPGALVRHVIHKDTVDPGRWDVKNRVGINVHLFSPDTFREVTGKEAPPTPITAELYARSGLPFFELDEEQSGIGGQGFDNFILKSYEKLEREATDVEMEGGVIDEEDGQEKNIEFPVVKLGDGERHWGFFPRRNDDGSIIVEPGLVLPFRGIPESSKILARQREERQREERQREERQRAVRPREDSPVGDDENDENDGEDEEDEDDEDDEDNEDDDED